MTENPLVIVDELATWNEQASKFMKDQEFSDVLDIVIRLLGGKVPEPVKVAPLCVKLEAYSVKFRLMYAAYMGYLRGTSDANIKKNHYKELYTGIDRLVDSLKYLVK